LASTAGGPALIFEAGFASTLRGVVFVCRAEEFCVNDAEAGYTHNMANAMMLVIQPRRGCQLGGVTALFCVKRDAKYMDEPRMNFLNRFQKKTGSTEF